MTRLIINADDFGYCEAVNYGIISAHKDGIVTSTTMMANMPGVEHAVTLLKHNKNLQCGVHMTLSCGKPVLSNLKTIVDENENLYKRITADVVEKFDLDEVYEEFCAQIEKVKSYGIQISHLDSHHHVHTLEQLKPVIEKILKKYDLPIRGGFKYESNYSKVVPVISGFYKETVSEDYFKENIETIKSYDVVDMMSHPAFLDDYILHSTSYAIERTVEHKVLTSKTVAKYLEENDVKLSTYKDI